MDFEDDGEYYRLVGFSAYPEPVKPEEPDDPYGFAKEVEPEEPTFAEAYRWRMRDCGLPNLYRNQFKDFTESTTLWEDADND